VWLNEGFATFLEAVWTEAHFGKDQADYERWKQRARVVRKRQSLETSDRAPRFRRIPANSTATLTAKAD